MHTDALVISRGVVEAISVNNERVKYVQTGGHKGIIPEEIYPGMDLAFTEFL